MHYLLNPYVGGASQDALPIDQEIIAGVADMHLPDSWLSTSTSLRLSL
jgi:hypothetical protein